MSLSVIMTFVALGLIWSGIYKASKMVARGTGKVLGAAGNVTGTEPEPANEGPAAMAYQPPEGFGQRTPPQGAVPSFLERTPTGAKRRPLVQASPTAPEPENTPTSEPVTAILRRQIPPSSDAPRSWLGGLPMMPAHVEWPCGVNSDEPDRGKQPLHFLAQIACEDLPPDLWDGAGPRTGWLLFFVSANSCCPDSKDERAVIHIEELGDERAPPADSAPVHDRVYTGGSYRWLEDDAVPAHWRRWPVDIVEMANRLYENEHGYPSASPENLAQILYEGDPVSPEERPSDLPSLRALTYGQAIAAVNALAKRMREPLPRMEPATPKARDLLSAEGGHAMLIEGLRERLAKGWNTAPGVAPDTHNPVAEFIREAIATFEPLSPEEILTQIDALHADRAKWREEVAQGCDRIAAMLGKTVPGAILDERHWSELAATFDAKVHRSLHLIYRDWGADDDGSRLVLLETRDVAAIEPPKGIDQFAIDTYLDPETRGVLPADYVASREPVWRTLVDNIPHRMGGYHDGVQSGSGETAIGEVLLLQLNSDDAMDWCWGDVGAYYFWIKHSDLAAINFADVDLILECH